MEQRRFSGKGHWYHETQSNHAQSDALPLVPEAANVDDRFLLDLALPDEIVAACTGWLTPARALCHQLFPLSLPVNRLRTLSAYDRLSTALTVAQACGVQRLCNHYAALLAPLPGPDSSRESNRRLAQITQYARQLASSPDVIDDKARNQLDEVGLSIYDIVVINQIIGFIGFQARVVAVFQALLGHPVRWLPGHHIQPHALPACAGAWVTLLPVVELRYASAHQLESLSRWQAEPALEALTPVLCHEPTLLDLTGEILINSREESALSPPSLLAAVDLLTRSPDRFSAAQFTPLMEEGLTVAQAINRLSQSAFEGWLNRLKVAAGKAE
ncbi:CMD domain-containing protein [Enterobacter kobei]|uniref:CMD domain-containing protein n=1 Tax=Enterobacter kobei TaxID=208224 RepID=UPI000B3C9346|nr:oxidoreductase [Enterobacter kobei]MBT1797548.1 CMD domain-containing protein [Enterobacter kobei]MBW7695630.1 CMD domain-containing protein [Enterobacter kobei]MBW7772161.1 CMD domain-containing protein [Enterobacter kobei]MCK6862722.1 CMD domain-containing protein [Enterobacter kobei]MCO7420370.1 CMD domain-containing protein [Enterobacter kobei]